jgi:uncharacterized protein YbjT (DUF2867 family)
MATETLHAQGVDHAAESRANVEATRDLGPSRAEDGPTPARRVILVTGATGKQGGAVVDALLALPKPEQFKILAVTRDPGSAAAQRLTDKSPSIILVKGDMDDVPALFAQAKEALSPTSEDIWGVFSVQSDWKHELSQGKAMIDESLRSGVKHFVYTSVDRGGEERSWENATDIPHFEAKYKIEHHLVHDTVLVARNSKKPPMTWTILRPVMFMDNLAPGFQTRVLLTAYRDTMKNKSLPWVAVADVGYFGAQAFYKPEQYNLKAITIAGDDLTFEDVNQTFIRVTGHPAPTTLGFIGWAMKKSYGEIGKMLWWFHEEGYKADIPALRELHPGLLNFETWLRTRSAFPKKE